MLGVIASAAVLAWLVLYLVLWPVVLFFYDPKGLRRYPCYSSLSGVTDSRHCCLASQGSRSKDLYEEHMRRAEPILRIGPNSLSFAILEPSKEYMGTILGVSRTKTTTYYREAIEICLTLPTPTITARNVDFYRLLLPSKISKNGSIRLTTLPVAYSNFWSQNALLHSRRRHRTSEK